MRVSQNHCNSFRGGHFLYRAPYLSAPIFRGYLKHRELANLCLHNIAEVGAFARNRLESMQRRPRLISAFWQQAVDSVRKLGHVSGDSG